MAINIEMPFEKARQQMAQWKSYAQPVPRDLDVDIEPPEAPNVLVDAVSMGGPADSKQKPLVRHVIIKDLHKIGTRLKYVFPKNGVFSAKAPLGLYALFDGQSCAGAAGPLAAEFCARNFHTKLLERLASLTAGAADKGAVETALRGTFEDLDDELLENQPDVKDGCGAAVALLLGQYVFTAALGRCRVMLCEIQDTRWMPVPLGGGQAQIDADLRRLNLLGGMIVTAPSGGLCLQSPIGVTAHVSRALGDRAWKGEAGGGEGPALVSRTPDVQGVPVRGPDNHPFLLLVASSVAATLSPIELIEVASEFQGQPRAACGEIAAKSMDARAGSAASAQCTAVEIWFLPERKGKDVKKPGQGTIVGASAPSAAKRPKIAPGGGTQSVRLRHILLKYSDVAPSKEPEPKNGDAKGKKVSRTRQDVEAILRRLIGDLRRELKSCKKPPTTATELVNATSKKFTELCKEHSECETARKGGTTCGDLGWVTLDDRGRMGGTFKELVDVLVPGQLSDIVVSDQGLHLVQRIA